MKKESKMIMRWWGQIRGGEILKFEREYRGYLGIF